MNIDQAQEVQKGDKIRIHTLATEVLSISDEGSPKQPEIYFWTPFGTFLYTVCTKV